MQSLDLKKELKHLYQPSAKTIALVQVPPMQFAIIDGKIEPGILPGDSEYFQQAVAALYGISYTLKFMLKKRKENPIDYPVMALEALWWIENGVFDITRADNWLWTAMIMQPDVVTMDDYLHTLDELKRKKPSPALDLLRLETFSEGLCIQTMHIGPYAEEPATLSRMRTWAGENGYNLCGKHHEIYLGDPRRTDPAKLRTVLRHPVERG